VENLKGTYTAGKACQGRTL
jgi:hypothetical protein